MLKPLIYANNNSSKNPSKPFTEAEGGVVIIIFQDNSSFSNFFRIDGNLDCVCFYM